MSENRVSYAKWLHDVAADLRAEADTARSYGARDLADGMSESPSFAEAERIDADAAIARELAKLVGELQRAHDLMPDDRAVAEHRALTALAAGYRPEGVEG